MVKNQYQRYQVLDKCFSNRIVKYTFKDLVKKVNQELVDFGSISVRTVRADIKYMVENYEVEFDEDLQRGKQYYYRYKDLDFSINKVSINDREIDKLKEAFLVLQRIQGLDDFGWVADALPKFQNLLGDQKPVVEFSRNEQEYKVQDLFLKFYDAIINQKVLQVKYQDFKVDEPYTILFHPYYIKEYNRRWFVFGLNQESGIETWNLAFDRIHGLDVFTSGKYIASSIDWKYDYFADVIGVTRFVDAESQIVMIETDSFTYKYIASKPMHPSHKRIKEEDGKVIFQMDVVLNRELKNQILSFGANLKVLEPLSFADELKQEFQKASKMYS